MFGMLLDRLHGLYRYRYFILGSVRRDFAARYRQSLLGAAWAVFNPLAMIFIYTVIFSQIMHAKLPGTEGDYAYSIYLCAGMLTWNLFTDIVGRGQCVFLENANLLKKLNFSRLCLPVIVILNAVIQFAIIFSLFLLFLLMTKQFPGWPLCAVVPLLLLQILFAISLGLALGIVNVFFRDVGQFFGIFLQFWFWLTPIVYPLAILPESVQPWVMWNPMARLIGAYQTIFVHQAWPDGRALLPVVVVSGLMCILAWRLFQRRADEMVDEL